jgi:glycosyltransferase involved in cell wall biosynthesis
MPNPEGCGRNVKRILVTVDSVKPLSPCHDGLLVARHLAECGYTVETIEFRDPATAADVPEATMHVIPWPRRLCISAVRRTQKLLCRFRPDEVHVWGLRSGWLTGLIASLSKAGVKRIHPLSETTESGRWHRFRKKNIFDTGRLGSPGSVRLPLFRYERATRSDSRQSVRERLGLPRDSFFAISVNPLFPRARIKDFLFGGDLLRNVRDDAWFVVVGDGPQLWRLERYRRQLSAHDRILLLPSGPENESLVAAADVYVQPSAAFSDCSALRFAMASGVPGIGITRTVHTRLIRHLETGFLVERGARNEIGRCMNRVIAHPEVASEIRERLLTDRSPALSGIDEAVNELMAGGSTQPSTYTLAGAS